jgi:hypothetical protein
LKSVLTDFKSQLTTPIQGFKLLTSFEKIFRVHHDITKKAKVSRMLYAGRDFIQVQMATKDTFLNSQLQIGIGNQFGMSHNWMEQGQTNQ